MYKKKTMHLEYIIDTTGLIYLAVDIIKSVAEIMLTWLTLWLVSKETGWGTKRMKGRYGWCTLKNLIKKSVPINRDGF
jgi:hypothetical protein